MVHRIELSTTLLIAIKKRKTVTTSFLPKVTGITIFGKLATIPEKGTHAVDELGNIISRSSKKEVAA